ncbi:zinc finger protein OZF-like [Pectinophora gossypiella]|uniref:zinc finger protein OZF-like n=1 Tax=Pectinophora gossypiella TaxID=13191 RepID=UPI00214EBCF5|nr:zinc finger protein OZF-like [Pectinophora gossypiella]
MDSSTCRICLNKKAFISVFDKEEDDIQYSTKIMRCVSVVVDENDYLPKFICTECLGELCIAYRFVERCEEADKTLRGLLPASTEPTADLIAVLSTPNYIKEEQDDTEHCDDQSITEDVSDYKEISKLQKKTTTKKCKKKQKKRCKNGPIQCVVCGRTAACRSAMEAHMRCHTGEKPFQCDTCNLRFTTKGGLTRHIANNHSKRERRFMCETCGNSFFTKSDIITHMRIHTNEKPYKCAVCGASFRQIASLIRHRRSHSGEKPFACQICGKCFADRNLVRKHQNVHTDERKFSCHLCQKAVKTRTALNTHMKLHLEDKQNICSFCGMAFSMKGNLHTHMRRKHSEKAGDCSICGKTFANLDEHMRKHTGERPFGCSVCGHSFTTKRSLSHHIIFKHENASKFKCSIGECSRSFPTAVMLEFHLLKQHSNHTPFVCPHCARGFYRNSDLSRHLKISHMEVQIKIPMKTMPE